MPHDWRSLGISAVNKTCWYRRVVDGSQLTEQQVEAANDGRLRLGLGTVAAADTTFINGIQVGTIGVVNGTAPHDQICHDYLVYRTYAIPPGLLHLNAPNVVEVRVHSPSPDNSKPAGLFDVAGAGDERVGPLDPAASEGDYSVGFAVFGEAWYQKSFNPKEIGFLPGSMRARIVLDGCYMNCSVYVNDVFIGRRPYGYSTHSYDITGVLAEAGNEATVKVRVQSMGRNSRWYPGSGLYRHVHLKLQPLTHIVENGVSIIPTQDKIDISRRTAEISVEVTVASQKQAARKSGDYPVEVAVTLYADKATVLSPTKRVGLTNVTNTQAVASLVFDVTNITLWSPETPTLYFAEVRVISPLQENAVDVVRERFGIRHISFSPSSGFMLNGKQMKLKGGCVHHANGPIGSKAIDRADERRVELLKMQGYNAIRTSHNPVSPAFVKACDKLGMLLMEEAFDTFEYGKNPQDYHVFFDKWSERDITDMVLRDQNSPSIVMWSVGNEIPMRQ